MSTAHALDEMTRIAQYAGLYDASSAQVYLESNEYAKGPVDQIVLRICDLRLTQDILSDRDIRLAYRMASDLGCVVVDKRGAAG